jgi:hypothetical protein
LNIHALTSELEPASQLRGDIGVRGEKVCNGYARPSGGAKAKGVYLDGEALFDIALRTVLDRAQPGTLIPVEDRVREIEERQLQGQDANL